MSQLPSRRAPHMERGLREGAPPPEWCPARAQAPGFARLHTALW